MRKLLNSKGETISEVLIAALIGCFGSLLFATMAASAVKITKTAILGMGKYTDAEALIEIRNPDDYLSQESITINDNSGHAYEFVSDGIDRKVKVYGNEEKGIYGYQQ